MNTPVIDVRENQQIPDKLREMAALLEAQGANPYRAGAYRKAADTIARLTRPVRETFDAEGAAGLDALPHIGKGIAAAIAEILITGRWNQLERLRGTLDPVQLFQGVPGIGPQLAQRMHETLHVDTLEALETAAHDGRLESVPGVGTRRAAAWRATLASMLKRIPERRLPVVVCVDAADCVPALDQASPATVVRFRKALGARPLRAGANPTRLGLIPVPVGRKQA